MRLTVQIALIVVCAASVCFLLWSSAIRRRAFAQQCASNLTSCSLGALISANDRSEMKYASSLLELSNELSTPKVLICPTERNVSARIWNGRWSDVTTKNVSYDFVGAGHFISNALQSGFRCPV